MGAMGGDTRRPRVAPVVPLAAVLLLLLAAVVAPVAVLATSAGATGLLPPANPPANIPRGSAPILQAIDGARGQEGVGPLVFDQNAFAALSTPEQLFVVENLERTDRGLAPFVAMTAQLNSYAQGAANVASDPSFPRTLSGGPPVLGGGGIWAGGWSTALAADFEWMYQDGWGGSPQNTLDADCTSAGAKGCWSHRDVILTDFSDCAPSGFGPPVLVMGGGENPRAFTGGSLAAIFVCTDALPTDVTFTWLQAEQLLGIAPRFVAMVPTPDGRGYWEVKSDGTLAAFGDAGDFGDMAGQTLNAPIVGMAATPDGLGYWFVAADGGIFSFGDARFFGSMGAHPLNRPIVGMAVDEATGGYWLVAADGGIFSFGAPFYGSTGAIHLNQPIVGVEAAADDSGYRFVAADGGVFCFNVPFEGSMGSVTLAEPVSGMAATGTDGYWLVADDGGIFTFGGAGFFGSSG